MSAIPEPRRRTSTEPPRPRRVAPPGQARLARGEGALWICGGALVLCLLMIAGLLTLVVAQGAFTFWPVPAIELHLHDGRALLGEVVRQDTYRPSATALAALPDGLRTQAAAQLERHDGRSLRELLRIGNFELSGEHYVWISDFQVASRTEPEWALVVEREAWGRFYGTPVAYAIDGSNIAARPEAVLAAFAANHAGIRSRVHTVEQLRNRDIGRLSGREESARLLARRAALRHGEGSDEHRAAVAEYERVKVQCSTEAEGILDRIRRLQAENARHEIVLRTSSGQEHPLPLADIVRAYTPNRLGWFEALMLYLSRWWEFLTADPRESNSEGGVYPAIFGTVLMTLLMSLCVVPFGVLAALYLREYAKGGILISAVRIAVNNLAGVPSIVFGVFGLGFFCYLIGGRIDSLFYPERLPSPTFGKGALIWASLTLALLTLPVVIVATEEALAAVPGSMREGSYACGASKWQTIRRIVLPRAMPGIMTGMILAMARGAGEVAPLMLVGAAKMAPELPLDATPPFLHPSRSFMHLGFHIYDLGFHSQNSEAAKPMVYTTTLLLIAIVFVLNVAAVMLRNRLRARYVGAQF